MVSRMDDADRRMTSQVGTSGPKLLALLLLDLAERYGVPGPENAVTLPLPLTQHELATMIGRARETVARALRCGARTAWSSPAACASPSSTPKPSAKWPNATRTTDAGQHTRPNPRGSRECPPGAATAGGHPRRPASQTRG